MADNINIRFSIIIPVYKVEKYLNECVDSVRNQTFKDIEIILVDDGSPDECPRICDEYVQKDNRIVVLHKENGGLSSARNAGLQVAKGEYVIFLDSDDYYCRNDFLEILDMEIGGKDLDALFFQRSSFVDGTKDLLSLPSPYNLLSNDCNSILYELAQKDQLEASAVMKVIKRSYLVENNLYFKNGIYSEDVEWFFRFAKNLQNIAVTNVVAYCYRLREGSITHTIAEKNINDLWYSVTTYGKVLLQIEDEKKRKALLNYLAYQYYIVLGLVSAKLEKKRAKIFLTEGKKYKWLTRFSISGKTKKAAIALRCFGVKAASYFLGIYIVKNIK